MLAINPMEYVGTAYKRTKGVIFAGNFLMDYIPQEILNIAYRMVMDSGEKVKISISSH